MARELLSMTVHRAGRLWVGVAGAVLLLLAACGGSGGGAAPGSSASSSSSMSPAKPTPAVARATGTADHGESPGAADAVITIKGFGYAVPNNVLPGARVMVANMDQVAHTVTANASASLFDVVVAPGSSATFTAPTKPGSYPFHCTYHSNMHGTLVVQ